MTTTTPTTTTTVRTIDLGTTRIGDIYSLVDHPVEGRQKLFGYLEPCTATAYVDEHRLDDLSELVHGHRVGDHLRVPHGNGVTEFGLTPLASLDLDGLIDTCSTLAIADAQCVNTTGCISLIDANGNPDGSFRTTLSLCIDTLGSDCTVTWTQVAINRFPNPNCRGRSARATRTLARC